VNKISKPTQKNFRNQENVGKEVYQTEKKEIRNLQRRLKIYGYQQRKVN
jgi:N-acetyl-anhydromuramyl-L-alanine amidase AmpD